jgi:hypothetical protein
LSCNLGRSNLSHWHRPPGKASDQQHRDEALYQQGLEFRARCPRALERISRRANRPIASS